MHNVDDTEAFKEEQAIEEAIERQQMRHNASTLDQHERTSSPKRSSSTIDINSKRRSLRMKKTS